ncbi:hypothetical protein [Hafnia paralvei]|uniref:electron transfer flavoprotein subunit beta/FixA family protein n=1 Tax=Hafnia paralvei TaxID=546367 RepID=UPI00300C6204
MKALLAFKPLPDFSMFSKQDWVPDERLRINTEYVRTSMSCFDETAAELLLRMQATGQDVELAALAVDSGMAESHLKQLLALGFHQAFRAQNTFAQQDFNPITNAEMLANFIRVHLAPLVVIGMQFGDSDDGQTAAILAEILGWPYISHVCNFVVQPQLDTLRVSRLIGGQIQHLDIRLPAIFAVGNSAQAAALRVPTLKQKLAAGKKSIEEITVEPCEDLIGKNAPVLIELSQVNKQRETFWIEGDTPQQKAQVLYQSHLRGRIKP